MNLSYNDADLIMLKAFTVFFTLVIAEFAIAGNEKEETIRIGEYECKIAYTESRELKQVREIISGAKVDCGGFPINIVKTVSEELNSTIEDERLTELLSEVGVEVNLGLDQARLKANIELRNIIAQKSKFIKKRNFSIEIKIPIKIEELKCYNQQAYLVHDVKKVKVDARKDKAWLRKDIEFEFEWEEAVYTYLLVVAKYDESCCRECQIKGKANPVTGEGNRQLWARIPYKKQAIYLLPLYWEEGCKVIDLISLLPEDVKKEIEENMSTVQPL